MSHRTGQPRRSQRLLRQVAGLPRTEYDALASSADDSPDIVQTLAPKTWVDSSKPAPSTAASTTAASIPNKSAKPIRPLKSVRTRKRATTTTTKSTGNPAAKRLKLEDANCYSSDEPASADAPSVAPHAVKTRTVRQHPKPPAGKQLKDAWQPPQTSQSPLPQSSSSAVSGVRGSNVNHNNIVASLFAGKSTDEALEDGQWSVSTPPTPSWEDKNPRKKAIKKSRGRSSTAGIASHSLYTHRWSRSDTVFFCGANSARVQESPERFFPPPPSSLSPT